MAADDSPAFKDLSSGIRLPSLDGLRALSIVLVMLGHVSGTRGATREINLGIGDYSHLGVVVFFVISGLLITNLLLAEHAHNGTISLKLFYARRSLRIFPASYVYLSCLALLFLAGVLHLQSKDLWYGYTYTVNYQPNVSWPTGHLWSLSVEEQFYLLWPFVFLTLGPRRSLWAISVVMAIAVLARSANRIVLLGTPYHGLPMFPMVADSLAAGCLLALIREPLERRAWYRRLFRPLYSTIIFILILAINRYARYTLVAVFGTVLINLGLAILIHRCVCSPDGWVGKILNWKPVTVVGILSYSLYLWQQLFLNRNSDAWINAYPQNLAFAVAAAVVSYVLLEEPLLRLRGRLRAKATKQEHVQNVMKCCAGLDGGLV